MYVQQKEEEQKENEQLLSELTFLESTRFVESMKYVFRIIQGISGQGRGICPNEFYSNLEHLLSARYLYSKKLDKFNFEPEKIKTEQGLRLFL